MKLRGIEFEHIAMRHVPHEKIEDHRFSIEFKDAGEVIYATLDEFSELVVAIVGLRAIVEEREKIFGG